MSVSKKIGTSQRWSGLDLFRGFAVYAVVLLHADEGVVNVPAGWNLVLKFSEFAVPFFLAASFWLAIDKLFRSGQRYALKKRVQRLIVPYLCWSGVYLVYKSAKYFIDGDVENLNRLFARPSDIIFFGGAAFHLYFIPLLVVATLSVKLLSITQFRKHKQLNWVLLPLSLIIYQLVLSTNNQFDIASGWAFRPILESVNLAFSDSFFVHLLSVIAAWTIRCLPYLLTAILIAQTNLARKITKLNPLQIIYLCIAFCLINSMSYLFIPSAFLEILRGYSAVLTAIAISRYCQGIPLIDSLGNTAFGIYLIHLMILEIIQITSNRLNFPNLVDPSLLVLFLITTFSFFASWFLSIGLMKSTKLSKLMFGI